MFGILISVLVYLTILPLPDTSKAPVMPVRRGVISSAFGLRKDPFNNQDRFHAGIDIAARAGSKIFPLQPGRVSFSGPYKGFGNLVVIQHGEDITTHYAHLWGTKVKVGEFVNKDSVLGFVGNSGRSTGAHLHFEIRYRGIPVNPAWILTQKE